MERKQKWLQTTIWMLIFSLGLYILYRGLTIVKEHNFFQNIPILSGLQYEIEHLAVEVYMPGLIYEERQTSSEAEWLKAVIKEVFPLYSYTEKEAKNQPDIESRLEYELLIEAEKNAEMEAQLHAKEPPETTRETETEAATTLDTEIPEIEAVAEDPKREPVAEVSMEQLKDSNYLLNSFYTVDPSTTADSAQINLEALMSIDMKLETDASKPQILIYHTHSQEAFADSLPGDANTSIVGVGSHLAQILQDTYGYQVIHHTKVYDMIDGELDRNKAYTLAAPDIQQILEEHPSIEVVIDLHRDGVDGYKFVKNINGKPTAQIMFFNGLSRTARNGEIDYLPNRYIEDNLAFSFQLQLKAAKFYPGWTRNIYLQSLRYNLHLRPRALLIESGTQLNTVEEEMNAMEPLADILNQVLRGQ